MVVCVIWKFFEMAGEGRYLSLQKRKKRLEKQFSYQVISDLCRLSICVTSTLQVLPRKGYQQFILMYCREIIGTIHR